MSIGRLKMVTPTADQAIKRSDDGLFRGVNGDLPNDGNARLVAGTLEGSNVNAVEQMVGMIAASRQFEQQIKMLQTAESNDKTASQLLSMNG
jgi:flagellar basal-body rod protein FlgF